MKSFAAVLVLAALPAALSAQPPTPTPREESLRAQIEAEIARHVEGDPIAAVEALRRALPGAAPADRPRLLAALALLLDRLGRGPEAAPLLEELSAAPAPYGPWAGERLVARRPPAQDPVGALIDQLELGHKKAPAVEPAFSSLQTLGSLALPALLERLEHLGPFGFLNAMELLKMNPDPRIYPSLEALLRSPDPARRLAAARFLKSIPARDRGPLAAIALDSSDALLRIEAAEALAEDAAARPRLLGALAELARDPDPQLRVRVAKILERWGREAGQEARALLETLVLDPEEEIWAGAIETWVQTASSGEEPRALELRMEIPHAKARARLAVLISKAGASRHGMQWDALLTASIPDLLQEGFFGDLNFILENLGKRKIMLPSGPLLEMLRHPHSSSQLAALDYLRMLAEAGILENMDASLVEEVGRLLFPPFIPDVRYRARYFLIQWAPQYLVDRIDRVLAELFDPASAGYFSSFLVDHGDHRAIRRIVDFLKSHWNIAGTNKDLCEVIRRRSDATNLEEILDLVRIPNKYSNTARNDFKSAINDALARWFGPVHVADVLARIREIDGFTALDILDRVRRKATPEQEPVILQALDTAIAGLGEDAGIPLSEESRAFVPVSNRIVVEKLIPLLQEWRTVQAAERLERILTAHQGSAEQVPLLQNIQVKALQALLTMPQADHARILQLVLSKAPHLTGFSPLNDNLLDRACKSETPDKEPVLLLALDALLEELIDQAFQGSGLVRPGKDIDRRMEPVLKPSFCSNAFSRLIPVLAGFSTEQAVPKLEQIMALGEESAPQTTAIQKARVAAFWVSLSMPRVDHARLLARVLAEDAPALFLPAALGNKLTAEDPDLRKLAFARILASRDDTGSTGYHVSDNLPQPFIDFLSRLPDADRRKFAGDFLRLRAADPKANQLTSIALQSLGDFKEGTLAPVLAEGLRSSNYNNRMTTVAQLLRTFSPEAVPFLLEAMKDDHPEVRKAAAQALEEISTYFAMRNRFK